MKIVISASGEHLDAQVDPRFGRAKWFILYDTQSDQYEANNNSQVLNLPQGAGIQAAQHVVDKNAEVVLTGHCGPNAFRTLSEAGVKVVLGVSGPVSEAVSKFKRGELTPSDGADVEGHW